MSSETEKQGPFYITTAIDYANGAPHLGHAYEKVLTDVIARFQRLQGRRVHFLTGLDEHGQKVQQNALARGIPPQQACDETAALFLQLLRDLGISNDDYLRTTQPRHKNIVQQLLQQLFDAGLIYKAEYTGFYSVRQEQFVLEKDKLEDGSWPEIFGDVTPVTESNYFFRLSRYQPWLVEYLNTHPDFIFPKFRQKQVLEFLKEPINDLCISRPKERLTWGIELPFDPAFVTYVWFDALVNYYSAVAEKGFWPADAHVIGKDILVPPHAVYWPCMLNALGLALPRQLIVHGWWTISGSKASKSAGNALNSLDLAKLYGADVFRYYVIREMNVGQDSDFSAEQFKIRYRTDLGNDLGNLLNRLLNMGGRYAAGKTPDAALGASPEPPERELRELWAATAPEYLQLAAGYQFHTALETLWNFIRAMNRYTEHRAPWKLGKSADPADRTRLEVCLAHIAEGLRLTAVALSPVMPEVAAKIQQNIGLAPADSFAGQLDWSGKCAGATLAEKAILFPPVEEPATEATTGTQQAK
ncbi:MAG: class I tRNA ligase family protein [Puniceicoccales bacterium]|jgi:methionyl-tRNA synthetase|nr:class I tRNA ligase family protein [Puniceicoccales bacterium]